MEHKETKKQRKKKDKRRQKSLYLVCTKDCWLAVLTRYGKKELIGAKLLRALASPLYIIQDENKV